MSLALIFTAALVALVVFGAAAVFLTEGDDGAMHRPHWPARYPHVQRRKHRARKTARGIYGDACAHLRKDGSEPPRHAEVKR